jgi:hypothetical protein
LAKFDGCGGKLPPQTSNFAFFFALFASSRFSLPLTARATGKSAPAPARQQEQRHISAGAHFIPEGTVVASEAKQSICDEI